MQNVLEFIDVDVFNDHFAFFMKNSIICIE